MKSDSCSVKQSMGHVRQRLCQIYNRKEKASIINARDLTQKPS